MIFKKDVAVQNSLDQLLIYYYYECRGKEQNFNIKNIMVVSSKGNKLFRSIAVERTQIRRYVNDSRNKRTKSFQLLTNYKLIE